MKKNKRNKISYPRSVYALSQLSHRLFIVGIFLRITLVLRFLHAHHLGEQVRLWITQPKGIHMRLPGQAFSPAMIDALCTLFPAQETAKHPGLAISRLLIEVQGGHLLCVTNALLQDPYTKFIITLPHAEEIPRAGVEVV